ncbi:MAG: diguanylate cyclase [Anaerolineaceae bacterium]|nr:diguanylate cyclase [Anaerolineaceae bacterium]
MGGSRILIVEDDGIIGRHIQNILQKLGYQVLGAISTGEKAIEISSEEHPDLVLMDINLEGELDGVEAAGQIYGRFEIPVIYLTAFADNDTLQRAKITDPFGYILKPFEERNLFSTIEMALRKHELEKALKASENLFRTLVDNQGEGIGLIDAQENFTFANPAAEVIFGTAPQGLAGRNLGEFTDQESYQLITGQAGHRQLGEKGHYEIEILRPDGEKRIISVTATPQFGADGNYERTFGIFRDVTEQKKIERAEAEQRALAEALRDTAAVLNSTLDLNEVFDRILTNIGQVVPQEGTTIMLVEGDEVRIVRSHGYAERGLQGAIQQTRFNISTTPNLRWMAETGKPLAIPSVALYDGWISILPSSWVRSGASAPIQVKGKLVGFLTLDSSEEGFFNQTHADRLKAFADQAAIAIENAGLYEESQQRARFLALLNEITRLALSATNLVDMLQTLAAYMAKHFEADQVYIETWDDATQLTKMMASYAGKKLSTAKSHHKRPFKPGERTFTYSVLEAGSALFVADISQTPYIDPALYSFYRHTAMLGLPLIAGSQKLGAVIIGYDLPHSFRPEEIDWGEQAAGQIALAVANARLLETERQKTAELTYANNLITALGHVATRIEIVPDPDKVMETLGKELHHMGLNCALVQADPVTRLPAVHYISIRPVDDNLVLRMAFHNQDGTALLGEMPKGRLQDLQDILCKTKIFEELVQSRQAKFYSDLLDSFYKIANGLAADSIERLLDMAGITAKTKAIALPLSIGEKAADESFMEIGLLAIWGDQLKENDLAALSVFASQVAITLENARLLSKVQQLAITDELTGLYNRRGIFELGQEEIKRALSSTHLPSLILMDVDFFKKVNDTYGHDTGDEVIRAIAQICRKKLRDIDLIGRYGGEGGDEFVILLPATDLLAASQVAERLRQVISESLIMTEKGNIKVTVSLGVTSMATGAVAKEYTDLRSKDILRDESTQDWAALLNRADQAMYMAKSTGRNCVVAK